MFTIDRSKPMSNVAVTARIAGMIFIIAGIIWLPISMITHDGASKANYFASNDVTRTNILITVGLTVLGAYLIYITSSIDNWALRRSDQREFFKRHADLNIRVHAIHKVVSYMKRETSYDDVRFNTVARALVKQYRRSVKEVYPDNDTFPLEVFLTYLHFAFKGRPLPLSAKPRHVAPHEPIYIDIEII